MFGSADDEPTVDNGVARLNEDNVNELISPHQNNEFFEWVKDNDLKMSVDASTNFANKLEVKEFPLREMGRPEFWTNYQGPTTRKLIANMEEFRKHLREMKTLL